MQKRTKLIVKDGKAVSTDFTEAEELARDAEELEYANKSGERELQAVLDKRASEYPPIFDYLDAIVKNDEVQKQEYIDACLLVKQNNPKPEGL